MALLIMIITIMAVQERGDGRKTQYFAVSYSKGSLYKSKNPQSPEEVAALEADGYEQVETTRGLRHHKKFKSISGRITRLVKDVNTEQNFSSLGITLTDGNENYKLSLGRGSVSMPTELKTFIKSFANTDLSRPLSISFTKKKHNDKEYLNCWINYVDALTDTDYPDFIKHDELPKPEEKQLPDGSTTLSYEKQDAFLYGLISKKIEEFKTIDNSESAAVTPPAVDEIADEIEVTEEAAPEPTPAKKPAKKAAPKKATKKKEPAPTSPDDLGDELPF